MRRIPPRVAPLLLRAAPHPLRAAPLLLRLAALLVCAAPCLLVATRHVAAGEDAAPAAKADRFKNLPAGWEVTSHVTVPAEQTAAIAARLGVNITKLTNTTLKVHGVGLQVNIAECPTDKDVEALHAKFLQAHGGNRDYVLAQGRTVVELTRCQDVRIVRKAAYVLGFKPRVVTYRLDFEAAPLERGDYMSWNALFNAMQAWRRTEGDAERKRIDKLKGQFTFGRDIVLRACGLGNAESEYSFTPKPSKREALPCGDLVRFTFPELPERAGLPCVKVSATVTSEAFAVVPTKRKAGPELLGATAFWPSDDAEVKALAEKITAGCTGDEQKVAALLEWLMPGRNIKFEGPVVGSRWGVKKVLEQRFGHCWDFSDCFVTLCRAVGVPCRQVAGWVHGMEGHIWAEVLLEGKGWMQVDPTAGMSCTSAYIPYLASETGEMSIVYLSMPKIVISEAK